MHSGYSLRARLWGWLLAISYAAHTIITINLPRTDKALPLRDELRGWHYLAGTLVLIFVVLRIIEAARERRRVHPPAGLPAGAFLWGRALAWAGWLILLSAPALGLLYAWSQALPVHLGPLPPLPQPFEADRWLWQFSGYFHSGLGFMLLLLNLAVVLTAAATTLIHGRGLLTAFPPGHGFMAFAGLSTTVYAFATFRSPEPGPLAVGVFWLLALAVFALGRWLKRRPRAEANATSRPARASGFARLAAPVGAAAIVAAGTYGPYAMFRVTPFPRGGEHAPAAQAAGVPADIEWHPRPAMQVAPPTAAELAEARRIGQDTYKWCTFCHKVKAERGHLVGPNLRNIWGQRAGTVPNFADYSDAMVAARARGLVWNDATIAAYIENPDRFMPGTSMIISSGPVTDPKVRAAVVTILKAEAMGVGAKE